MRPRISEIDALAQLPSCAAAAWLKEVTVVKASLGAVKIDRGLETHVPKITTSRPTTLLPPPATPKPGGHFEAIVKAKSSGPKTTASTTLPRTRVTHKRGHRFLHA
jgi:hypothetical protein